MTAEAVSSALAVFGALGLALAAAVAAPALGRKAPLGDRVAVLQLLAAKAVAGCVALAAAVGETAFADAGLVLALLGAVAAAVFAQGGGARREDRPTPPEEPS